MKTEQSFFARIHREGFTWKDSIFVILLTFVALFALGTVLAAPVTRFFHRFATDENRGFVTALGKNIGFLGYWAVLFVYLLVVKADRPMLRAFGTEAKGNTAGMLLIGLLIGFVANAVCVGAALLHGDIRVSFSELPVLRVLLMLLAVFVQSSGEEILCRGFLYQKLRKSYKDPLVAVLVNPVVFVILHLLQPGFDLASLLSTFIVGILFSVCVYSLDSLWMAMALHAAWNFTQAHIFGLPNSGNVSDFSIFRPDAATAGNSIFYNTTYGVEATWTAVLVLAAVTVLIVLCGRKKGIGSLDVWADRT